jgi:hypothetical protein
VSEQEVVVCPRHKSPVSVFRQSSETHKINPQKRSLYLTGKMRALSALRSGIVIGETDDRKHWGGNSPFLAAVHVFAESESSISSSFNVSTDDCDARAFFFRCQVAVGDESQEDTGVDAFFSRVPGRLSCRDVSASKDMFQESKTEKVKKLEGPQAVFGIEGFD